MVLRYGIIKAVDFIRRGEKMFKHYRTIHILNSQKSIEPALLHNDYFTCHLADGHFFLAQKDFFSKGLIRPVAKGYLCSQKDDTVVMNLEFDLRLIDKLLFFSFIFIAFAASVACAISAHAIEIPIVVLAFLFAYFIFFSLVCKYNCHRFCKKIFALFDACIEKP